MALDPHLRAWSGSAFRHIPERSPYGVLDLRFAGRSADNRWNHPGQPTLYLASDPGVALAEFARHLREHRSPALVPQTIARSVFRLRVAVDRLFNLCDARLWDDLSLRNAPHCFLDRSVARAVADYLRQTTPAQGLLVPSMAFLDDASRWVLVLFLEKLPSDVNRFLVSVELHGRFETSSH